jgi:hypothetical protein
MTENAPHTAGIYFDGINFGRGTMLRIRRTLDEAIGPTAAIDFHSGNTLSPSSGGPALQYMHMLPFVSPARSPAWMRMQQSPVLCNITTSV